jgi:hypothetical protein
MVCLRIVTKICVGVNPLQTTWMGRGTVSSRVALLLRSAEVKPLFERFVFFFSLFFPSIKPYDGSLWTVTSLWMHLKKISWIWFALPVLTLTLLCFLILWLKTFQPLSCRLSHVKSPTRKKKNMKKGISPLKKNNNWSHTTHPELCCRSAQ